MPQKNISIKQEGGTKSAGREIGIVTLNKENLTEKRPSEEDLEGSEGAKPFRCLRKEVLGRREQHVQRP